MTPEPLDDDYRMPLNPKPLYCSQCDNEVGEDETLCLECREGAEEIDTLRVEVADGKYTVVQDASGRLSALRYGETWRDCCGDGLIYALACEVIALREAAARTPKVNIRCECSDGVLHGSTYLNVVRVDQEDDDSFTAVTDHWPR